MLQLALAAFPLLMAMSPFGQASLVSPGDIFRMEYDFSTDPSPGPWSRAGGAQIEVDPGIDPWEQSKSVEVLIFDSSDLLLGQTTYTNPHAFPITSLSNAVEFAAPTSDPSGYVLLESLDARFEMSGFRLSFETPGVTVTASQELPIEKLEQVPAPTPLALLTFGLLGMFGLARGRHLGMPAARGSR
jgi:hypothetical protein